MLTFETVKEEIKTLVKLTINNEKYIGQVETLGENTVRVVKAQKYDEGDSTIEMLTVWAANRVSGTLVTKEQILGGGSLTKEEFTKDDETDIAAALVDIEFNMENAIPTILSMAIMSSIK